jgi:Fe-S-cluster containining protein
MSEKNKDLCDSCDLCCKYVAIEIDKPANKKDYDNITWQLLHENVNIFIDFSDDWYIEFVTPCSALNIKTKLCKIYKSRPSVCRDHKQKDCVAHNNEPAEKKYFKTVDDFKKYLKNKK